MRSNIHEARQARRWTLHGQGSLRGQPVRTQHRRQPWRALIAALLAVIVTTAGCAPEPTATGHRERPRREHLVEIYEVRRGPSRSVDKRTGTLRARHVLRVFNEEEGRIVALPFFEGDAVSRGDLLLRLDDALLRAELEKARATERQASVDLKRIRNLVRRGAASLDEQARAETALDLAKADRRILETRLARTRVMAPFAGLVSERLAEPGDVPAKNSHILTMTDPTSLVTELRVSELLLPRLTVGDPVKVRIDALGDRLWSGAIVRIHPDLDPVTRQGMVEVTLDPIPAGARSGQFARITLETTAQQRMLVPFSALQRDRKGAFVYRLDDASTARRTPVHSGIRIAGQVEILAGLAPGQRVITRGFLGLTEGKRVTPVGMGGNGDRGSAPPQLTPVRPGTGSG